MYSTIIELLKKRYCNYKMLPNGFQVILPVFTSARLDLNYYDIKNIIQDIIIPFEGEFVISECYYVGFSTNSIETEKTVVHTLKGVNDVVDEILGSNTVSISLKINNTLSILLYSH